MRYSQPKNEEYNPTEHQIQNTVMSYLRTKGYYVERLNSGKFVAGEGRYRRFIMGVAAGTPDVMAFRESPDENHAELLFLEIKRPKKKPTELQVMKMQELEEYGARCFVITSIDDLVKANI